MTLLHVIGAFMAGGFFGIIIMAMLAAASDADDRMEAMMDGYHQQQERTER
jgi:hypothetical protein